MFCGLTYRAVGSDKNLEVRSPKCCGIHAGKATGGQLLTSVIEEHLLQNNVVIHEPVEYSEVPQFIAFCDVATSPLPDHPYWRFQCPLKLLEYMTIEKVIILSDISAYRSVVDGAKCGIYTHSTEPADIARAIGYAYDNSQKLNEWGITGRKIVEERHTWEKVASDFERHLLSI